MGILDAFSGSAGRNAGIWEAQQAGQGAANIVQLAGTMWPQAISALQQGTGQAIGTLQGAQPNQLAALLGGYQTATGDITGGYGNAAYDIASGYGGAQGTLETGLGQSLGSLYGGLGGGQQQVMQGANMALGNIGQGLGASLGAVNQGFGAAQGVMGNQMGVYNPYIAPGQQAQGMLANALGLGGAAGTQAAQQAFQTGPGYQWQVQQALDAVQRNAGAQGLTGSGNALTALQNRGNDLANQSWGQWLSNLSGVGATGLSAANAQTGAAGTLAGLLSGQGATQAGLFTGAGQQAAGINQGTGNLLGAQTIGAGQQAAGLQQAGAGAIAGSQQTAANNLSNLATGQATNLGTLATNLGLGQSGIYGTTAAQVAGLQNQLGLGTAGVYGNWLNTDVNALNNAAQSVLQGGNQAMMAGQQASATELNTMLGGLGTLLNFAKPSGSAGTGPSGLSNLGSMAGGLFGGLGSFLGL